jgi:hypothetical protein
LLEGEFGVGGAHQDACHITRSALGGVVKLAGG